MPYVLLVSLGNRLLLRDREALFHRLGVPVLRMLLESGVFRGYVLVALCQVKPRMQRTQVPWWSPAAARPHVRITRGERHTEEAHEGLFTNRADDIFRLFVRFGLALRTL